MKSKKQIKIALAIIETNLWTQQARLNEHKRYFFELFHNNIVMLPAVLLPAFLAGWQCGKITNVVQKLSRFIELMSLTLIAQARRM